jgi:hypothetical protein
MKPKFGKPKFKVGDKLVPRSEYVDLHISPLTIVSVDEGERLYKWSSPEVSGTPRSPISHLEAKYEIALNGLERVLREIDV